MTGTTQLAGISPSPRIVYSADDRKELTSHPPLGKGMRGGSGRVDSLMTAPARTTAVQGRISKRTAPKASLWISEVRPSSSLFPAMVLPSFRWAM